MIRSLSRARASAVIVVALTLYGCAAQMAYKEGQDLVSQGRGPEGLARLEEASRLEPGSAQYRMAVLQTRDRLIATQLARAEILVREVKLDEAEQLLRAMAAAGNGNDRVLATLRNIDRQRRGDDWMKEAQAAADRKDIDIARSKLKSVLLEDPDREDARRLAQKLDDQAARPQTHWRRPTANPSRSNSKTPPCAASSKSSRAARD